MSAGSEVKAETKVQVGRGAERTLGWTGRPIRAQEQLHPVRSFAWLWDDCTWMPSISLSVIAGVTAISGRQPARLAHQRCRGARRTREHHASTVAQRSPGSHLSPQPLLPYRQTRWSLLYKGETASTHTNTLVRLRLRDFSCQDLNDLSNLVFFTIKVFSASASKTQPPAAQQTPQDLVVFCASTSCRRHSFRVDLKRFIFCHIWDCGRFSFRSHFGCVSNELMSSCHRFIDLEQTQRVH